MPPPPPLLGVMALSVVAMAAIMLAAGLDNLQARTVQAQTVAMDREALVAFYNSTGGDSWNNNSGWLSDAPMETGAALPPTPAAASPACAS